MFGYIITTHYNNYDLIIKSLDLLFENCLNNSIVVLYVNETTDDKVLNIKKEYCKENTNIVTVKEDDKIKIINFEIFYIENQIKNNGLTGTWNQGITYILKNYPQIPVITILGHDTFLNETINYIYKKALNAFTNNILEYYGPLYLSWEGKSDELWQDELNYKKYEQRFLIGSLLCFPINSLIKNMLPNGTFFDNSYPFGYNDIDWYNRFIKIGGKAVIVPECLIDHKYCRTWVDIDPRLKNLKDKYKTNNQNNILNLSVTSLFNKYDTIDRMKFDWILYSQKWRHLKFSNERQAYDHYMIKGRYLK